MNNQPIFKNFKENKKANKILQIYILDNFERCGKENFTKLALSALDILALNAPSKTKH